PQPDRCGEVRGGRGVLLEGPQGERSQPRGGVGLEEMGTAIDGVDGLAPSGLAGLASHEVEVGAAQVIEDVADLVVAEGSRHGLSSGQASPSTIRRTTRSRAKRRYSAVERTSSIGVTSRAASRPALSAVSLPGALPRTASSAARRRTGVAATLPAARRRSAIRPPSIRPAMA